MLKRFTAPKIGKSFCYQFVITDDHILINYEDARFPVGSAYLSEAPTLYFAKIFQQIGN